MNKIILTVLLGAALGATARAQNPLADLSVSGTIDWESQYVYRAKKITNTAFQPKVEFGYPVYGGSIYAGVWTNQPISRRTSGAGADQNNEIDLYGGYAYPLDSLVKGLSLDVGDTYYWYPEAGGVANNLDRSDEMYVGLTYDTTSVLGGYNLSPSLYYYYDFILNQSVIEFSLKYTWDMSSMTGVKGLSLNPRAYVGWLDALRQRGDQLNAGAPNWRNSYTYWGLTLDLNYKLNDFTTLFAGFRYAGNNDGNVFYPAFGTNSQGGGTDENVWAGAGVKFSK